MCSPQRRSLFRPSSRMNPGRPFLLYTPRSSCLPAREPSASSACGTKKRRRCRASASAGKDKPRSIPCSVLAALTTVSFRVLRQLGLQWKIARCFSAMKARDGRMLAYGAHTRTTRADRGKSRLRTPDLTQLTAAIVLAVGCNSYESLHQSYLHDRALRMKQSRGGPSVRPRITRCKQYSLAHTQVQA